MSDSNDMKQEYDFTGAERAKFYHRDADFQIPVYLESDALAFVEEMAQRKGIDISDVVNDLIRADFLEMLRSNKAEKLVADYDPEADVLYLNLERPQHANDSEVSDDGVIIRYSGDRVVGYTILNAGSR